MTEAFDGSKFVESVGEDLHAPGPEDLVDGLEVADRPQARDERGGDDHEDLDAPPPGRGASPPITRAIGRGPG